MPISGFFAAGAIRGISGPQPLRRTAGPRTGFRHHGPIIGRQQGLANSGEAATLLEARPIE
jgi:hypothetical protein